MDRLGEIEALKGIYTENELETSKDEDGQHVLRFQLVSIADVAGGYGTTEPIAISLTATLPPSYPLTPPSLSISSTDLSRESREIIKTDLIKFIRGLPAELMMMDIACWVQEHAHKYTKHINDTKSDLPSPRSERLQYALLQIDHMRSKSQYVKTLLSWASSDSLSGRIVFYRHLILVVIVGNSKNIKDFILKLKTQTIDVDSRGRSCKEKMMSVISEGAVSGDPCQYDFLLVECTDVSSLEAIFENLALGHAFHESVRPLINRKLAGTNAR